MKLITNRISTGKAKRFEDFVAGYKKDEQIKTASIKTAEEEEAKSSGQLDVEPLHQEGESTVMPKAGPSSKKDTDGKAASSTKKPDEEGTDSGQPKAEGSEKFTNDPKSPSKEEKGGSTKEKVKVAGEKGVCKECGEPNFLCKCDKEAGKVPGVPDGTGPGKDSKECPFNKNKEDKEDKEDKKDKEDDKKESSRKTEFVKIANLDEKNKGFLREYWRQLFGDDYVNAIIADK